MNDLEIKKALECCSTYHDVRSCKNCPLDGKCEPNLLEQYALDLINRKDQENENLKAEIQELKTEINMFRGYDEEIKAEAYKECIEKVKEKSKKSEIVCSGALVTTSYLISAKNLNNLLKELVGDGDGK